MNSVTIGNFENKSTAQSFAAMALLAVNVQDATVSGQDDAWTVTLIVDTRYVEFIGGAP